MKILVLFLLNFLSLLTTAQELIIERVDASAFPNVSLTIKSKEKIDKANVNITDNKKVVSDFQWVATDAGNSEARAVCFLIETSSFVTNNQLAFVKNAVKSHLLSLNKGTVANVGFYFRSNSVEMLRRLSTEFTDDFNTLSRDMESKLFLSTDEYPETDLFKVVYECLDFIGKKKNLPGNKKIILISTGNNNGSSAFSINDCIQKAKEKNIIIDAIGLRSGTQNAIDNLKLLAEKTTGNFTYARNESDINLFLQPGDRANSTSRVGSNYEYEVLYKSLASLTSDSVVVTVKANNVTESISYLATEGTTTTSNTNSYFNRNRIPVIAVGVILLLILIGLFVYFRNKRKKRESEESMRILEMKDRDARRKKAEKEAEEKKVADELRSYAPSTQVVANPKMTEENNNKTRIAGVKKPQIIATVNGSPQFYELTNIANKIGRNSTNDIVINDSTISGSHAVISFEGGKVFISDSNSTNGTFVNGNRIQRSELNSNDIITLGKIDIRYNL